MNEDTTHPQILQEEENKYLGSNLGWDERVKRQSEISF